MPHTDIVFAGLEGAPPLTGSSVTDPDEQAALISALGPRQVIVKLGADGATAKIDSRQSRVPVIPVAAVHTVGAGDAFAAGYLADLLSGVDVPTSLSTAAAAGAFARLGHGDWESLPTRPDLRLITGGRDPIVR